MSTMPTMPTHAEAVRPHASVVAPNVQAGVALKNNAGQITITFAQPFTRIPVVVVSPYWQTNGAVVYPETINEVDLAKFTVNSANLSPNYYVSWVAYGSF